MNMDPAGKYRSFAPIEMEERKWPAAIINKPPLWCSVDLRDGNQALVEPMGLNKKLRMFHHLVDLGFKEIEVGFPSASETDFEFLRHIIENNLIPDDVTIQILTQAREALIRRSFESLEGAKQAILHLYNSTSTVQRRVVFGLDRKGITQIAKDGARLVKQLAQEIGERDTDVRFQYSPESFTGTELDFALDVCHEVIDLWAPKSNEKVIINLPATVEMSTPNIYADQIEWMHTHFENRDQVILSLHPHNDRGTAVAAAELGLMAGADRIEGTLFGNGERTGNVDVVTLALNLFSQGIDPQLDFSQIKESVDLAQFCNQLPVHQRHPYAGELVYTAFSGSHQDAIKKGMSVKETSNSPLWEVPYLPIDPQDVGRSYQAIIRVNSQSGKGGIAWLLEHEYGIKLPRELQIQFSKIVQQRTDHSGQEITAAQIKAIFDDHYVNIDQTLGLINYEISSSKSDVRCEAFVTYQNEERSVDGIGNGPINAFVQALRNNLNLEFSFDNYRQDSIGHGSKVKAITYISLKDSRDQVYFGVGIDENTNTASLRAIISAVNRFLDSPLG